MGKLSRGHVVVLSRGLDDTTTRRCDHMTAFYRYGCCRHGVCSAIRSTNLLLKQRKNRPGYCWTELLGKMAPRARSDVRWVSVMSSKPSWYLVATVDKITPPAQPLMAGWAGATSVAVAGRHAVYGSQPAVVAALIAQAAAADYTKAPGSSASKLRPRDRQGPDPALASY